MKVENKKYITLFVIILLSIIIIPFFLSSGGISADSISYFKLANGLPRIQHNLFPIGYPLLLELGYFFTQDYFYSSKILGILSITLIGAFSYYKKFYFRETVILLTFRIFIYIYVYSYSETVFLTLLYFLIYYFHEYLSGNLKGMKFILPASLIMTYMVMVRYSGVYIYGAIGLFFIFYTWKHKLFPVLIKKGYFYFLLVSGGGILLYSVFNYYNFQNFFGESIRSKPNLTDFWGFTYENLLGVINIVNPIFSMKILQIKNNLMLLVEIIIIIIDILFLFTFIYLYIRYFKNSLNSFHQLLLLIGGIYLLMMFLSEYNQGIESLNTRMLCESSLVLLFSFLILFFTNFPDKIKWMFLMGCISLFYNVFYLLKTPESYLHNRQKVENILNKKKEIKYFYDDTADQSKITVYTIPIINKKIEHAHPYNQSGDVNYNILGTISPFIQFLGKGEDTVIKNKSLILYNSEIK